MQRYLLILCLFLLLTLMTCQSASNATNTETGIRNKDTTITLTIGSHTDLEIQFETVFNSNEFKAQFPNIKMKIHNTNFGGHHNRLVNGIDHHTKLYDIEVFEIGYLGRFAKKGGFTDLSNQRFAGAEAAKNIVPFASSFATKRDGKIIALPFTVSPVVLFYRKDIADEVGVDPSSIKTWEEFIEIGKKLTADTNGDGRIDRFAITHVRDVWPYILGNWKTGLVDKEYNPFSPKERYLKALMLAKKIRFSGIEAGYEPWSAEWITSFKNEEVVMICSGGWLGYHFRNWMCPGLKGKWRVAPLPEGSLGTSSGDFLGIPESTQDLKKDAAWEVIKYLCTNENAQRLCFKAIDMNIPALSTIYNDPVMLTGEPYFGGQKVNKLYADLALQIPAQKITGYDFDAYDIFSEAVNKVLEKNISIEEAFEDAITQMEKQIK